MQVSNVLPQSVVHLSLDSLTRRLTVGPRRRARLRQAADRWMNPPPFAHRVERSWKAGEQICLEQQLLHPHVGDHAGTTSDLAAHRVSRAGRAVHLGPTEFRLLHHFMLHPGRVFSREHLLYRVWGPHAEVEMRTVDVHIRRLRKALNTDGCRDLVRTVRSVGYALDHAG